MQVACHMLMNSRSDVLVQIKHRKAEIAQERGGLIASIGQTIVGPRFVETDEVQNLSNLCTRIH